MHFLDFYYIAWMDSFTVKELNALDDTLYRFQKYKTIFQEAGVRNNDTTAFSLPCQHVMTHYRDHIENFGTPSGLCMSTPESKHKSAVKRSWCCSNQCEALKQILLMNERNDKLASAYIDFKQRGMLEGTATTDALYRLLALKGHSPLSPNPLPIPSMSQQSRSPEDDDEDIFGPEDESILSEVTLAKGCGMDSPAILKKPQSDTQTASHYPQTIDVLGEHFNQRDLPNLVWRFLYLQDNPDSDEDIEAIPLAECPYLFDIADISVFYSAQATFLAPSNPSGVHGMYRESIRSTL